MFEACKKLNMDGIEYRLPLNIDKFLDEGGLEEFKKEKDIQNIKIIDVGSSLLLNGRDEEKLPEFIKCLHIANELNAAGIRVFLGDFIEKKGDKSDTDYNGLVKTLGKLCDMAEKENVEIWIETHNDFSTGKILRKLLDDVSKKNLKIIWDIMHPIEEDEAYPDTMKYLGDDIVHLHIKDGRQKDDKDLLDYLYTKLGEGEMPVKEIVKLCEECGYKGYYSLEWEPLWKKEIEGYDTMEILEHYVSYMNEI